MFHIGCWMGTMEQKILCILFLLSKCLIAEKVDRIPISHIKIQYMLRISNTAVAAATILSAPRARRLGAIHTIVHRCVAYAAYNYGYGSMTGGINIFSFLFLTRVCVRRFVLTPPFRFSLAVVGRCIPSERFASAASTVEVASSCSTYLFNTFCFSFLFFSVGCFLPSSSSHNNE